MPRVSAPQVDSAASFRSHVIAFLRFAWESRPSVLLSIVLGPIACIVMIIAQIKRLFAVGSVHKNVSHLVSNDPEVMNPLLALPACELARRVKLPRSDPQSVTSLELTELYIKQIIQTNPLLNAVIATRFAEARAEAKSADAAIRDGTVPADADLWGVPFIIKECFEFPEMPYTVGIVGRRGIVGKNTTPAIAALQRAGAVVLGSTNTSEGCMWHESSNKVYGTTNNPYDLSRVAGGSSGGCAVALSACMGAFTVTSDIGGSTRIPASYNGLFGHKPTGGAVSNDFTHPSVCGAAKRFCQLGPTCRFATDLWPILTKMLDPKHNIVKIQDPNSVKLSDLIVYNVDYNFGNRWILSSLHPEMLAAHKEAIEKLRAAGATIKELDSIPELREGLEAFTVWSSMLFKEKSGWFDDCIREGMGRMIHPLEFILSIFDLSVHTLPSMLFATLQRIDSLTPKRVEEYCALGEVLKKKLHTALASEEIAGRTLHKVLLTPALSCMAPTHGESLIRTFDVSNICLFNAMELPATAVPSGKLSSDGLPIGLQFVGNNGMDFVTIGAALRLEELGAKWLPPRPSETRLKYE